MPHALFTRAQTEGSAIRFEWAAARTCIGAFAKLDLAGMLFLNFSAGAIRQVADSRDDTLALLRHRGVDPQRIVIELTEQSTILDVARFLPVISALRAAGAQFALDDLNVVRDMGIGCGQGFFFGRPHAQPARNVTDDARDALRAGHIAVFPENTRTVGSASPSGGMESTKMMVHAPTLPRHATNNDVLELFNRLPDLHAVAVVEHYEPVALINRRSFMDRYALPYHREVFGKRPCLQFANASPVIIEQSMTVEQMAKLLASDDQRYLADGFVITDNHGKYAGLGTGEKLVRAVTEVRIEAARYANPLTFLPGNIPISSHISRLLGNDAGFSACYVDLNDFKPFNDQYGYWQGDEVLKFAAAVLADVCDPTRDFSGHVGGDDFLILFQSEDWQDRLLRANHLFNEGAQRFHAPADRLAGGIHGEDRRGNPTFFGFVTMTIGGVCVESNGGPPFHSSEEIASVAALAKRHAKLEASGFAQIDASEAETLLGGQRDLALDPRTYDECQRARQSACPLQTD
jgi:GGDEF domain-containing protein